MIASIVLGTALLTIGLIIRYFSIHRNSLFGYRTHLSMKNEKNWKYANLRFSKHAILIGLISLAVSLICLAISIDNRYTIFGLLTLLLVSIITIEIGLRKFDKKSSGVD